MDIISTPSSAMTFDNDTERRDLLHNYEHNSHNCRDDVNSPSRATLEFLRQFARVCMPTASSTFPTGNVILN